MRKDVVPSGELYNRYPFWFLYLQFLIHLRFLFCLLKEFVLFTKTHGKTLTASILFCIPILMTDLCFKLQEPASGE